MPLGPINSRLIVDTNIENVTNVDLQVNGAIVGDIGSCPARIQYREGGARFRYVAHGQEVTRRVYLSVQGNHRYNFTLEVGDVEPSSIQVTIDEKKEQLSRSSTLSP